MNENKKFDLLAKKMFGTYVKRNPDWATYLGLHQYDHLMPDESRRGYLENIAIAKDFLKKFRKIKLKKLTAKRKIDRELAIHYLNLSLFYAKNIRQWESNPDVVSKIGDAIFPLFVKDFAPFKKRLKSIILRLKKIPKLLKQTKTRIKHPVKLWVIMAVESCERIPAFFEEILKTATLKKTDKKTLNELEKSINKANREINSYKLYLEKLLPKSKENFAVGEKNFKKLLELRKLGLTQEQILAIGSKYLRDSKKMLKKIANEIKPGSSIEEVNKKIEKNRPADFQKTLQAYRKSIKRSKRFITKKNVVTMPKSEELKVIATPAYMRHFTPFAAYFSPAKFDKKQLGIYIVTPTEKGNIGRYSYPNIENTSVHEGYPGHHLQLTCANTNPSLIRLMDHATEFVEGWAHYCEEYMKELGYGNTPEEKFIQTKDLIWRAARIIIDIKLSTCKISFDEAVEFLIKEVGMDKEGAVAEVKRYTQSPSYQLSYLIGKHLIKQLKEEMKRRMGKNFSDKFFHDTMLYAGSLPIYFMRKIFENKLNE